MIQVYQGRFIQGVMVVFALIILAILFLARKKAGLSGFSYQMQLLVVGICASALLLIFRYPRLELTPQGGMVALFPGWHRKFTWDQIENLERRRGWLDWHSWDDGRSWAAWHGDVILLKGGRRIGLGGAFTFGKFSVVEDIRRTWRTAVPLRTGE